MRLDLIVPPVSWSTAEIHQPTGWRLRLSAL